MRLDEHNSTKARMTSEFPRFHVVIVLFGCLHELLLIIAFCPLCEVSLRQCPSYLLRVSSLPRIMPLWVLAQSLDPLDTSSVKTTNALSREKPSTSIPRVVDFVSVHSTRRRNERTDHLQNSSGCSQSDRGSGDCRPCQVRCRVCRTVHEEGSQVHHHCSRRFQGDEDGGGSAASTPSRRAREAVQLPYHRTQLHGCLRSDQHRHSLRRRGRVLSLSFLHSSLAKPGFGPVGIFSQSGALASAILNEVSLISLDDPSCRVVTTTAGSPSSSPSVMPAT